MNYKLIILFLVILSSCSRQMQGYYISECFVNDARPALRIHFFDKDSFQYFYTYGIDTIKGTWKIKNRKLFTYSPMFSIKNIPINTFNFSVSYNFSPNPNDTIDCFRLKRNKLCSISKEIKHKKRCCFIGQM